MKRYILIMLVGVLLGTMLFGGGSALASTGILATPSTQAIYVDGQQVNMTAFSIGGNNYVKLRDIGRAVDFSVEYDAATNSVQIDSSAPYTEEVKATATTVQQAATQPWRITAEQWSREDFSRQANPAVFTGIYDRGLYNTIRQTILDSKKSVLGECAYTMANPSDHGTIKRLMGRMDGLLRCRPYIPDGIANYCDYPRFFSATIEFPDNYDLPRAFIQPAIAAADRLPSGREKVEYLNDYLCTRMDYRVGSIAVIRQIFSDEAGLTGNCGSYAAAFNFLCDAAGVPCMMVSSKDHTWNLVYADGKWLHVDVAANDAAGRNYILLTETNPNSSDIAPEATAFLKELMVPGSTR